MVKIKKTFYDNLVQAVLVSFITMIFIAGIIFLFVWSNRIEIIDFLVKEYKSEQRDYRTVQIPILEEEVEKVKELEIEKTYPEPQKEIIKETPTVVEAVKKARPAVVSILINRVSDAKQLGSGSGFLVSSDGLIVTNRHVISQDNAILTILLNDGREYRAEVLDRDPVLDIALLKIKGNNLPYLTLADSDLLEVGETVIAIGNALGEFKNTVSTGVVSGLSRSIMAGDNFGQKEYLDKVIQTDAAINKGNSGGPLLNIYGDVVGINVAMVEGSSSIGFSLPINSVKDIIESVRKTGRIIRPYVGIRYLLITPEVKIWRNLPVDYGILIVKGRTESDLAILPNSPAEKAGLQEGDIILQADNQKITSEKDFSYLIRNKKIGDLLILIVHSGGFLRTVNVILEQAPNDL